MTVCQQKTFAITLLVCSAGGGHTSAARALTEAFAQRYPACEVSTVYIEDIIGGVGKIVGRLYAALYNTALARGWYRLEPAIFALLTITTRYLYPLAIPALRRSLPAQTAHAWITLIHGAHPVLNHVLARRDTLRFTVVTDAVTLRPSWLNPTDICTFVSTDQAYQACIHAGLRPDQVRNLGHPVSPDFALPKPLSGESLFLDPHLPTLLILMGGVGGQQMYDLCQQLVQASFKVQVVACCGTNTRLLKKLKHWSKHRTGCFHVLGYTSNIPALMAQADVVMTKPGPGVMMEATAAGVPLLIDATRYTMFQERGNAEYVENHHLGYVMRERSSFLPLLKRLLFDIQAKAKIQKSIAQHQRPASAIAIADAVYEVLSQRE